VFFKEAMSDEYKKRQFKVVENAKRLASNLLRSGYDVLTGGTDSHLMLVNVADSTSSPRADGSRHLTGLVAQKCLEDCGIVVDRILVPYADSTGSPRDDKPGVASGIRLGTPIVTRNGMGVSEMDRIAELVDAVLKKVQPLSECQYAIDESFAANTKSETAAMAHKFPVQVSIGHTNAHRPSHW
jgi:glycine hydroxymethyltransferase